MSATCAIPSGPQHRQPKALFRAPFAGACVAALGAATSAQALETVRDANGKAVCIPAAQINAQLEAEGQKVIAIGDRPSSATGRPVTIKFTSRPDGTLGNILEGDGSLTRGIKSTCFVVDRKLTGIRVNDPTNPNIPSWALVDVDPAVSQAALKRDTFGRAGVHNESMQSLYRNNFRLVFLARAYSTDGTRLGPMTTFVMNPSASDQVGGLSVTNGYGVTNTAFNTIGTTLTAEFDAQLNRATQVASPQRGPQPPQ